MRAALLEGRSVVEIASALAGHAEGRSRAKGKIGGLIEAALGASGVHSEVDFPTLGVELKTVPVSDSGRVLEATFVCTFSLLQAEYASWVDSHIRHKLARVLWLPIIKSVGSPSRVGRAVFWEPTQEQERVLAADFDEIVGLVGAGKVECLNGRVGRWLQARPKARNGGVRTSAFGQDGEKLSTIPRAFYLRQRFTQAIVADPAAVPP
ncbi:MAG: DNA mismatch repair protein MutH [Polyangiaceae bacterium]|nr:DNA mismatch repair protein MutH [Polyangiaceae bacterium]